jgi:SAM-dependent methyltransferase
MTLQAKLQEMTDLDNAWLKRHRVLRQNTQVYGWEPYPPAEFVRLLYIAMARNQGPFIDLGCGIGTKVLLAEAIGLKALGVELFPAYAAEAKRLGANVVRWDLRDGPPDPTIRKCGIVYINHPFRDTVAEDILELRVQEVMAPGAVLITVNNIRTEPEDWDVICRPPWSDPEKIRFDWVAQKPGGNNAAEAIRAYSDRAGNRAG